MTGGIRLARAGAARRKARPSTVLATVCACLTVITMNISLLNVGLPTLARELHASNTGLEWVVDGYALVFAACLMAAGTFGDRFGGRPIMLVGLGVFGACSLGAALATTTGALIAARCGMGVGGALVTPMTLSVMRDVYPDEAGMRRATGVWAATASAGAIVAPLVGGALLTAFWWGSLFLVNIPLTAVTLVAVWFTVPDPTLRRATPFDWAGVALSGLVAGALVFALIEGPSLGWGAPLVAGAFGATAVASVAWWWWERRSPHPLVDLGCFGDVRFTTGCSVVGLQYFISFGASFLVTQYVQLVLGLTPLATGFAFVPSAAVVMIVAPYGARAFGRFGARLTTTVALLLASAGLAVFGGLGVHSPIGYVLGGLILLNVAIGLMAPGTTSMVMSAVRPEQAGMASGMQNTTRQLGGALGVAALGSLAAVRYGSVLTAQLQGTSAARYLPAARGSLATALHVAAPTSPAYGVVVRASETAFVDGVHLAAWCTAGLTLAAAGAAWIALKSAQAPAPAGTARSVVDLDGIDLKVIADVADDV